MNSPSLTVVVPAFNEEHGIEAAVDECCRALKTLRSAGVVADGEVVVVDDGSVDDTAAVLERLASKLPELRVIHHERNRGLGAALRSGFGSASGDLVFYTDADLPVDLEAITQALHLMDDSVVAVCGYRINRRADGPRRYLYSITYNWMCRRLFGLRLRDVNFAAKLLRADALRHVDLRSEGSFIDAEVLIRLSEAGGQLREFPANYQPRIYDTSTLSSPMVMVTLLRELIGMKRPHANRFIRA